MRVITLTGPKRSGKNTLADMIGDVLPAEGATLRQAGFADPLRWAGDAIGLPTAATRDHKDLPCAELGERTGREFLIELGALMRRMCPTYFVDHMIRRLDAFEAETPCDHVAITDMRFSNELDALTAWAAKLGTGRRLASLWVERPGANDDEILEPQLRARCVVISNAGTLADLRMRAQAVAEWAVTRTTSASTMALMREGST